MRCSQPLGIGKTKMRSWRIPAIVCVLCLGVAQTPYSAAQRSQADSLSEISEPITPEIRKEFDDIISRFASDIPNESIKFHEEDWHRVIFIRLEDERFCVMKSCVTIVTTKCGHAACQYAPVLAPPRYTVVGIGTKFWGNFVEFPATQSNNVNTVIVNDRFIAAYHAL
jgi:hypothetical protein